MTKRTEKLVLSIYEYCVKAALKARHEGILSLDECVFDKGLTDTGEILFTRKVDKFMSVMLQVIVDGEYSQELNQSYLISHSRHISKKQKMLLNVASVGMDYIASGCDLRKLISDVIIYIGVDKERLLLNRLLELEVLYEKNFEYKLSEEIKERIKQINVFFKMKEDECNRLLKRENERLCELHSRVPEFKKQTASVNLLYKPNSNIYNQTLYCCCVPDSENLYHKRSKGPCFLGEIPVCYSMAQFWNNFVYYYRDVEVFIALTDDISNKIEKYLTVHSKIELQDEKG